MINFLGSSPSTLKPAGECEIDRRLSINIQTPPAKSTTARKQLRLAKEMPNLSKKTPPRNIIQVEVNVESPPKMDLDLRSKITASVEVSEEPMDTAEDPHDADDTQKEPEVPPTPTDATPVAKTK